MILSKDQQNWQTSGQTHQEERWTQIKNEKEIPTDTAEIPKKKKKKMLLYMNKLENVEERDNFLET